MSGMCQQSGLETGNDRGQCRSGQALQRKSVDHNFRYPLIPCFNFPIYFLNHSTVQRIQLAHESLGNGIPSKPLHELGSSTRHAEPLRRPTHQLLPLDPQIPLDPRYMETRYRRMQACLGTCTCIDQEWWDSDEAGRDDERG